MPDIICPKCKGNHPKNINECPLCGYKGKSFWTGREKGGKEITGNNEVIITDIRMSFLSMVVFMVKWAIATIPAAIILAVIVTAVMGAL